MRTLGLLIAATILSFAACEPPNEKEVGRQNTQPTMQIGHYLFELPEWWEAVEVTVPNNLQNEGDIRLFVKATCGKDTGTKDNWRTALKIWALAEAEQESLPVYIAHCYRIGHEHAEAVKVYSGLYELADYEGDNRDWYKCFLAYNAGFSLIDAGKPQEAIKWLARSAEFAGGYVHPITGLTIPVNSDNAIAYYSKRSLLELQSLKKTDAGK